MEMRNKVGEKIRMYRKLRGITLTQLADAIQKSKSVVSKYELGETACDVDTLCDICSALDIDPAQLMEPIHDAAPSQSARYGVFQHNRLCVYMLARSHGYHLLKSLLICSEGTENPAALYFGIRDFEHFTDCRIVYNGSMSCFYNNIWFFLENVSDRSDRTAINAAVRMGNQDTAAGLALMTSYTNNDPGVFRVLFSAEPLPDEQAEQLLKVTKEDLDAVKKSNIFGYRLGIIDKAFLSAGRNE